MAEIRAAEAKWW